MTFSPSELPTPREISQLLDRIEDRLRCAPEGLHLVGRAASMKDIEASSIRNELIHLWRRWDGFELGNQEVKIYPLAQIPVETERAHHECRILVEDQVIGERGTDILVICPDPWAEGADVVIVDDEGQRAPYASTVERLVLAYLGEFSTLFDDEGEYQSEIFDESTGELTTAALRRLLRRRLDFDPDGPLSRFELAQSLRRSGELRAANSEIRRVIKIAPEFCWAHFEQGRVLFEQGRVKDAERAFKYAAEKCGELLLQGMFYAWAALASEGDDRKKWAMQVKKRFPDFPRAYESAAREALNDEQVELARERMELGLAVEPMHVGLLALAGQIRDTQVLSDDISK